MKFAVIGPVFPYRGGIAHYTQCLDSAILEEGYQNLLISFRRQYPAWLYPGASDRDPSQLHTDSHAEYILDPLYPWTWSRAARKIEASAPDLVVIQWWTTFWGIPFGFIARRLRRKGIKFIYIIHNVFPHEKRVWDRWLAWFALRPANGFLAQTEVEKGKLVSLAPKGPVEVSPLPIFPPFSNGKLSKTEAKRLIQVPENGIVLLFFGIIRSYKGLGVLIDALGELKNERIQPHLIVAGEFWEAVEPYHQQIQRLGLETQVILVNKYIPNEEVDRYFSAADVLIAPYVGGTQSAAVALARGYGLPLIVTELVAKGMGETDADILRIVPANDSQALAKAIKSFVETTPAAPLVTRQENHGWHDLVQVLLKMAQAQP
jgi:D-inositol-3-phosphate glycosyltransferase